MARAVEVHCVSMARGPEPGRIEYIGGVSLDGTRWRLWEAEAIRGIKDGTWQFFVRVRDEYFWVTITDRDGREYLTTAPAGDRINDLLRLPECPSPGYG